MADLNADDRGWFTVHAWWQGLLPDVCRPTIAEWTWEKLFAHDCSPSAALMALEKRARTSEWA